MQAKNLVPISTVQLINEEIQKINDSPFDLLSESFKLKLNSYSVSNSEIDKIICEMKNNDLFSKCNSEFLRSDHTRKTFYKQHFNYVAPVDVYLSKNQYNKICSCQYIPIGDTLQSIYEHRSVFDLLKKYKSRKSQTHVLQDVTDGRTYIENELFQQDSNSLAILLFQDAFKVVNPLGSAIKKKKT